MHPNTLASKQRTHAAGQKTEANAIRFRIGQEIKFQYKKKQHLNQQLYHAHLDCAHHYKGMWQHMHMIIDQQLR
jgi:hypothetical protein